MTPIEALKKLRSFAYTDDSETEVYAHIEDCHGEPTCPGCWATDIMAVVDDVAEVQPQRPFGETRQSCGAMLFDPHVTWYCSEPIGHEGDHEVKTPGVRYRVWSR